MELFLCAIITQLSAVMIIIFPQAAYRGHQVRRQYRKVIWSVGVVEKAILRWRKKRKGLRGIANGMPVEMTVDVEPASTAEEGFFQASRQQAEDRFNRSVVRVQALFRCHRAQHEYRRMRIAHEEAKVCILLSSILICNSLWVDGRACENA
jgi:hypothetical protein